MRVNLSFKVNGQDYQLEIAPNRTLLDVLRDELGLLGTKKGCGAGKCGSCTVLLGGRPVNACLLLAPQAQGRDIITIEGLAGTEPHPLQRSFVNHGAVQCGYCTPGMILSAYALLESKPRPDRDEIKSAIAGNLCRCTGYKKIVDAIEACAEGEPAGTVPNQEEGV